MDANKLRTEVFEKTGIKVDTTDPVFALVALNEAVLADYARQNAAGLQGTVDQLKEQTRQLVEAGERTRKLLLQLGQAVEGPAAPLTAATTAKTAWFPLPSLGLAGGTALCAAILVLLGQALFAPRPVTPPPAAVTQTPAPATAPAMTPEQRQLMQNGEKLAKAWPKLDAKTQAKVQAAMQ